MPLSFLTMTLALAFMWFLCAPPTLVPDTCLTAKNNTAGLCSQGLPAYVQVHGKLMHTMHNRVWYLDQVPREVR